MTPAQRADRLASVIEGVGVHGLAAHSWDAIKQAAEEHIRQAVAAEREACAQHLEAAAREFHDRPNIQAILQLAAVGIRARGKE